MEDNPDHASDSNNRVNRPIRAQLVGNQHPARRDGGAGVADAEGLSV